MRRHSTGFTLVEVLVALMIVAIALAALMSAVSSTARASGYLRDKTIAQWIAMNRIAEVRLNIQQFGANTDKGELDYANRHWRYDTQYFNTDTASIRRIVVRVWPSSAKEKESPLAESASFLGAMLSPAGTSNTLNWIQGPTNSNPATQATTGATNPNTNNPNTGATSTGTTSTGTTKTTQ